MASLYLECRMGAAGDMLCAALYELLDKKDKDVFIKTMNGLGLSQVKIHTLTEQKCGIQGTRMVVTVGNHEEESLDVPENLHEHMHGANDHHDHHHDIPQHPSSEEHHHEYTHSSLTHIQTLIQGLELSQRVKDNALQVYELLAEAEARAHGRPVNHVHFHEVGTLDAIADIVGFCLLVEMLGVEHVMASPLHVGSGHVRTSHGILPVPAPATAYILKGVPTYSDGTFGELVTPTGAALIKHFASEFGPMPLMAYDKIGYGMGKKSFKAANCVRAFLGKANTYSETHDTIIELRCNIDDMTPEAIGFATEALLAEGARDVYVQPIYMKKNRPGYLLVCLCTEKDEARMAGLIFKHTTTIGVRKYICERHILERSIEEVETSLGRIRVKRAQGYGISHVKPEYDDVAQAARNHGISFEEAYRSIVSALNT